MHSPARLRLTYAALCALTIALGLASRRFGAALPAFVTLYVGDALWAAMVYWLSGILAPRAALLPRAVAAVTFAFVVEFSQLLHTPWLEALRQTRLGALALGQGFLWSDLVCYLAGVTAAALLDAYVVRKS